MRYPSHVYVMSAPDGLVKVGLSRQLDSRVRALSTVDRPVFLEWATPRHADPLTVEMTAHTLLADCHVTGEWFRASASDAIAAISEAALMVANGDVSKRRRAFYARRPSRVIRKGKPLGIRLSPAEYTSLVMAAKYDRRSASAMGRKIITDWLELNGFLRQALEEGPGPASQAQAHGWQ